jgi:hypothetical protein
MRDMLCDSGSPTVRHCKQPQGLACSRLGLFLFLFLFCGGKQSRGSTPSRCAAQTSCGVYPPLWPLGSTKFMALKLVATWFNHGMFMALKWRCKLVWHAQATMNGCDDAVTISTIAHLSATYDKQKTVGHVSSFTQPANHACFDFPMCRC